MKLTVKGNAIEVTFDANEPLQYGYITLPDGYSFEQITLLSANNCYPINNLSSPLLGKRTFPPVNSKSPCQLSYAIVDTTKAASFRAIIEKFGQIPDTHYFDKEFDPILVTGDDGKEYNVIPSDQFK